MPTLTRKRPPQRNQPMDWDQFSDGQARLCKPNEDFIGLAATFQQRARHAAERRGMKAKTWTEDGGICVQFYQPEAAS